MTWAPFYRGDGIERPVTPPPAPPWRTFPRASQHHQFQPPPGLVEAVNAAVLLRRPLLLRGPAGFGKSTVVEQVAHELALGRVLRWQVTSRSTLKEALYRYDALGRIHAQNLRLAHAPSEADRDDIADFLQLGPLGTALLPTESGRPRALLIDEVDKSDMDLPSDLLDVLERGEFEIPELARHPVREIGVRLWDSTETTAVHNGRISCREFPFIVLTSNDERDFPEAFLRRCIRFTMPRPTVRMLERIISAHLGGTDAASALVGEFVERIEQGERLAIDQLLNAVYVLRETHVPDSAQIRDLLLRDLAND
ncbi:AAA family ATPase [Kibdelosporangium phytohabitans]|uniref:ATPase n=1 Tax=Kibdelosporangium phytohabitans TaxID=860235 RepID=A0A0N9HWN6_9PSEU|nr:AAA family ATPase [Kibdelosporangium phytohabitans]ALG06265.1 ATPase [Kibdelosporangium phytohabitans]MBE1467363.1 MoxR-like ATPase [Kibdelosporangium phytohabitans]